MFIDIVIVKSLDSRLQTRNMNKYCLFGHLVLVSSAQRNINININPWTTGLTKVKKTDLLVI